MLSSHLPILLHLWSAAPVWRLPSTSLVAAPLYVTYLNQIINGLTVGMMYALIALGYTMVYGIIELINFAHGDVFMVGSFISFLTLGALGITVDSGRLTGIALISVVVAVLLVTMMVTGLLGVTIERFAYRPLRNAPRLAPLITAIGVSFILENAIMLWQGSIGKAYPQQFFPAGSWSAGGVTLEFRQLMIMLVALILMGGLHTFVRRTRMGRAMRAVAQDAEAARMMGVDTNAVIALTFLIGSSLGGAAGLIFGIYYGQINFLIGYSAGLKAFTAAVLGGIGNIIGAMLGGLLIGLIEAIGGQLIGNNWTDAIVFGMLILVLVLRPSGLLGQQVPDKV